MRLEESLFVHGLVFLYSMLKQMAATIKPGKVEKTHYAYICLVMIFVTFTYIKNTLTKNCYINFYHSFLIQMVWELCGSDVRSSINKGGRYKKND